MITGAPESGRGGKRGEVESERFEAVRLLALKTEEEARSRGL